MATYKTCVGKGNSRIWYFLIVNWGGLCIGGFVRIFIASFTIGREFEGDWGISICV